MRAGELEMERAELQERANIINRAAEGWKIAYSKTQEIFSTGWHIEKTNEEFDSDNEAVVFVVTQAWEENPLCLLTLDFLRLANPFAYVHAIKIAHGEA
jgi:hypothetical protein